MNNTYKALGVVALALLLVWGWNTWRGSLAKVSGGSQAAQLVVSYAGDAVQKPIIFVGDLEVGYVCTNMEINARCNNITFGAIDRCRNAHNSCENSAINNFRFAYAQCGEKKKPRRAFSIMGVSYSGRTQAEADAINARVQACRDAAQSAFDSAWRACQDNYNTCRDNAAAAHDSCILANCPKDQIQPPPK